MYYLVPKSEWAWKKTEWFDANSLSLLRKMTRNSMYFLKLTYSSIYYVNKQHESLWFEKTTFISSQFCGWEIWRAPQGGRSFAGITWAHCSLLAPWLGQEASLAAGNPQAASGALGSSPMWPLLPTKLSFHDGIKLCSVTFTKSNGQSKSHVQEQTQRMENKHYFLL